MPTLDQRVGLQLKSCISQRNTYFKRRKRRKGDLKRSAGPGSVVDDVDLHIKAEETLGWIGKIPASG